MNVKNPYRPGAGHMPPHLAGRQRETQEFQRLLGQDVILENAVITGLRGVGKTVLLETLKPLAQAEGWSWVGADLSETASLSEGHIATRLMADLALVTASVLPHDAEQMYIGFDARPLSESNSLNFKALVGLYDDTPGLASDKLKHVLETVWSRLAPLSYRGIVFAYDEAQNLADHADRGEYPLSLLLDVFQSVQRKGVPFMLVLAGLPTLFPKLVEARTFAERMFHVINVDRLNEPESRDAIETPLDKENCPVRFTPASVNTVVRVSAGYPYFIQFICREVFDVFLQAYGHATLAPEVPIEGILRKLDDDFFAGRWARATDRQRDLLWVASTLESADGEFSIKELQEASRLWLKKPLQANHISQLLSQLIDGGLIYRGRHGKYSFAVPLMHEFIKRQSFSEDGPLFRGVT